MKTDHCCGNGNFLPKNSISYTRSTAGYSHYFCSIHTWLGIKKRFVAAIDLVKVVNNTVNDERGR